MNSVALCLSTKLKSIRMTLNIWREMDGRTQTHHNDYYEYMVNREELKWKSKPKWN